MFKLMKGPDSHLGGGGHPFFAERVRILMDVDRGHILWEIVAEIGSSFNCILKFVQKRMSV